jgi:multiple sugar transport system permease protein
VGLDNYRDALQSSDFWSACKTTFIFTAISVSLELVLGMGMALLTVGTALTWRYIVAPDSGFLNQILQALRLSRCAYRSWRFCCCWPGFR